MIIFGGTLAVAFYCFLIGSLIPSQRTTGVSDYLLECVATSLWVSWFIAAATLILGVPSFFYLSFGLCFAFAAFVFARSLMRRQAPASPNVPRVEIPNAAGFGIMMVVVGVASLLLLDLIFSERHHSLFNTWDGIVSWNRWAVEMAQGEYEPIDGAYPILFPGLWSLIYRGQNDHTIWFLAKASMYLMPVLVTLATTVLVERAKLIEALVVALFGFTFFFVSRADFLLEGMMDVPVAVLMLCASVLIYLSIDNIENDNVDGAASDLRLAALFCGLAAITKQAGVLLIIPLLVAAFLVLRRSRASIGASLGLATRALAPLLLFLLIYSQRQPDPLGNVDYLRTLSAETPAGESKWSHAYYWLKTMWQPQMLLLVAALPFASFGLLKRPTGVVGVTFLLTAIIGSFIFADCCSYEPRNGWWILSLLVIGSLFGLCAVIPRGFRLAFLKRSEPPVTVPKASLILPAFLAAIIGAGTISTLVPDARARALQAEAQWGLLWPDVDALIRANYIKIGDARIVSSYQVLEWLPDMQDNYVNCWGDDNCAISVISQAGRGFVLTDNLDAHPLLRQFIGNAELLGEARGWQLYGPIVPSQDDRAAQPEGEAQ